jgi:hypothetical protein
MKNIAREIILTASKLDRRQLEIILMIVSLGLLVLSAGAPEVGGGIGLRSISLLK